MENKNIEIIKQAFLDKPDIFNKIISVIDSNPEVTNVIEEISKYIISIKEKNENEPDRKRAKIEENEINELDDLNENSPENIQFDNISTTIPIRKKLKLKFTKNHILGRSNNNKQPSKPDVIIKYHDIIFIALLPAPDRPTKMHHFAIFLKNSEGFNPSGDNALLFIIPDAEPKGSIKESSENEQEEGIKIFTSYTTDMKHVLLEIGKKKILNTISDIPIPEFYVTAYKGSKDGYLFLMEEHIIFGFKKPLFLLPHRQISSITYTCITRSTFNLVITGVPTIKYEGSAESNEIAPVIEFSMLNQNIYTRLDEYMSNYGLHNNSLAEENKAIPQNQKGQTQGCSTEGNNEGNALLEAEEEYNRLHPNDDVEGGVNFNITNIGGSSGDTNDQLNNDDGDDVNDKNFESASSDGGSPSSSDDEESGDENQNGNESEDIENESESE